jgi:hypothetical protein
LLFSPKYVVRDRRFAVAKAVWSVMPPFFRTELRTTQTAA